CDPPGSAAGPRPCGPRPRPSGDLGDGPAGQRERGPGDGAGGSSDRQGRGADRVIDLTIRGATVVTPGGRFPAAVHVREGRIVALGALDAPPAQVVDAGGLFAMPGGVDSHVHFMDPGDPGREAFMT